MQLDEPFLMLKHGQNLHPFQIQSYFYIYWRTYQN